LKPEELEIIGASEETSRLIHSETRIETDQHLFLFDCYSSSRLIHSETRIETDYWVTGNGGNIGFQTDPFRN
tara:strand:+ start:2296 stop:2511 length:216 start_codon:yes stop_codon:yes gene_type:complete